MWKVFWSDNTTVLFLTVSKGPGPILPEYPPQDSQRDMVERLLQVHKAHVDWLGELPCTLQDPAEGVELVQCSTARTKTTLLFLNPRFDYPTEPPLQNPLIDLTREA
ncbi:hypothetical protein AMECASPLE_015138 [Ameca splendens]|uniref:Uncharacterized protein n=1 Tax=Ameca splendens TaxID=208324 RepID=A0ABV0ZB07_9TELE